MPRWVYPWLKSVIRICFGFSTLRPARSGTTEDGRISDFGFPVRPRCAPRRRASWALLGVTLVCTARAATTYTFNVDGINGNPSA